MIVGRKKEQAILHNLLNSTQSEFVAVYGRRRVGKTFLIRETFSYDFAFQHTGILDAPLNEQLAELLQKFIIERIIFLDKINKGNIKEIYRLDKINKRYI